MRAVFVPQLVMPTPDLRFQEHFTNHSLQMALHIPFFMDALLACSGAEFHVKDVFHRRLADSYYFKALSGLRSSLSANPVSQQAEIIALRTILLLCMYEVSPFPPHLLPPVNNKVGRNLSCTAPRRCRCIWSELRSWSNPVVAISRDGRGAA
jgi:hypothetical protein